MSRMRQKQSEIGVKILLINYPACSYFLSAIPSVSFLSSSTTGSKSSQKINTLCAGINGANENVKSSKTC